MKKIFTLIAVAAMALTANAQGKYAMTEGEAHAFGDKVSSVANCSLTFGDVDNPGDSPAFSGAEADTNLTEQGWGFYTKGNGQNGNKPGGTVYVLKPTIAGSMTVAVVLNADKAFHVSEDGTDLADYAGIKVDDKYYGTYSFTVKAGSTYKVWCDGSKLGFYGFELSDASSVKSIKNVTENNGEVYNLAGQKVNANAKGLVIKNGKKFVNK
jgi:hypothetical protein